MEEEYWNWFAETGKITDYLNYRGIEICRQIIESHEGDRRVKPDHRDRHGDCVDTCRGI